MIKVVLKKSNSADIVSGSLDIRITPLDVSRAEPTPGDTQLVNRLNNVGISSTAVAISSNSIEHPSASSSVTGSLHAKRTNQRPSAAPETAMSSVEDQFGPLPSGYMHNYKF